MCQKQHYLAWNHINETWQSLFFVAPWGQKLSLVWRPSVFVYAKKMQPCHSQSQQFNRSTWWLLVRALRPPLQAGCTRITLDNSSFRLKDSRMLPKPQTHLSDFKSQMTGSHGERVALKMSSTNSHITLWKFIIQAPLCVFGEVKHHCHLSN